MTKLEELKTFARSLSKSERRYFRLQTALHENEKAYVFLFDLLLDDSVANIESHFKAKFPSSDLEMARKHLFQSILKVLRNYEDGRTVDNQLMNMLQNIQILFAKGIYSASIDEIRKGKQLAIQHEKHLYQVQFCRLELDIHSHFSYANLNEEAIQSINSSVVSSLEIESSTQKHSTLYHLLMYRYLHNGQTRVQADHDKLNDLLLEEFQLSASFGKSFEAEKNHLLFQSAYFLMTANQKASLKIFKELNLIFLNQKKFWTENPSSYLHMAQGMLTEMYYASAFDEMEIFINQLNNQEIKQENSVLLIRAMSLNFKMLSAYQQVDKTKLAAYLVEFSENIKPNRERIPSQAWINVVYTCALSQFGLQNFRESLSNINLLLNDKSEFISKQTRSMARILYVFVHLELENTDLAHYELRSFERSLKKQKTYHELEVACVQFVKLWLTGKDKKKTTNELRISIERIKENPVEARLLKHLPVENWLRKHG